EPGKVKTRLAAELGDDLAVNLYKAFVADLLLLLNKTGFPYKIACSPDREIELYQKWLGEQQFIYQSGGDLGEKMKNAFLQLFQEGFEKVLIIGSDSPDLKEDIFSEAFSKLDSHNAVIGPAKDGGY